jgi:hypothetical protein
MSDDNTVLVRRSAVWPNVLFSDRARIELELPSAALAMVEQVIADAYMLGEPIFTTLHFGVYPADEAKYPGGTELVAWVRMKLPDMPKLSPLPTKYEGSTDE